MGSVEQQIRGLLVSEFDVSERKLSLTSRLFHDLHLDGDDAVEFFDAVEKRFETNLAALYTPWNRHFGPEMGNPFFWGAAAMLVAIVISLVNRASPRLIAAEFAGLLVLVAITLGIALLFRRLMRPITLGDVVAAVEQGARPQTD